MKPRCGGKKRGGPRKGEPCEKQPGWGTDHVGSGRCKLHGGSNPIKHGRYSQIPRERLGDLLDPIEADPEPHNLRPELDLLRGHVAFFLKKHDTNKVSAGYIAEVVKTVEAIKRIEEKKSISLATLQRVVEQLGVAVARHVKDPDVLAAIERDWGAIQLGS
jgi:hypothetical protein